MTSPTQPVKGIRPIPGLPATAYRNGESWQWPHGLHGEQEWYAVPRSVLERLIACLVDIPGCYQKTGDYCGQDECPHGEVKELICPECGGGTWIGEHDSECPKAKLLDGLHRIDTGEPKGSDVGEHDGERPNE